jgi:hypothetical protein
MAGGECSECGKKNRLRLQTKLAINEPGDIYEQEAERVADQVMATSARPAVSSAPPSIQRFTGQPTGRLDAATASVDRALASPGRPMEPALRQDMEQRFGHDFSRVRVYSDTAAEQSAREVNANAYTVGSDIVFGAGRFAPGSHEGRRLIAHELAHVIQQTPASEQASESLPGEPRSGTTSNSRAPGIRLPLFSVLQRDTAEESLEPWDELDPEDRKEVEESHEQCTTARNTLWLAQRGNTSTRRTTWINTLSGMCQKIESIDDGDDIDEVTGTFHRYDKFIDRIVTGFAKDWSSVEKRYRDQHGWLLSRGVRSIDSIEAAKYIEDLYKEARGRLDRGAGLRITDEDYSSLKAALENDRYLWVGTLRGARIRAKQLKDMMNVVEDLRRSGDDASKYVPDWSNQVLQEGAHLEAVSTQASAGEANVRSTAKEYADLRSELLEQQERTSNARPAEKSTLEKAALVVKGGVESVVGIFVEAGKQAVDLVQIHWHFLSFGKYNPTFVSDLAAAAEQGATTGDLLKGMVTAPFEIPGRFIKALQDEDWEAIGREAVNLYMLGKALKQSPKMVEQMGARGAQLIAQTQRSLRILRARTVALTMKGEARFMPKAATPPPPAPPKSPAVLGTPPATKVDVPTSTRPTPHQPKDVSKASKRVDPPEAPKGGEKKSTVAKPAKKPSENDRKRLSADDRPKKKPTKKPKPKQQTDPDDQRYAADERADKQRAKDQGKKQTQTRPGKQQSASAPAASDPVFRKQVDQAVKQDLNRTGRYKDSDNWQLQNLDGPFKFDTPDPALPPDQGVRYQARFTRPDGSTIDVSVNYNPLADHFGTIKESSGL